MKLNKIEVAEVVKWQIAKYEDGFLEWFLMAS